MVGIEWLRAFCAFAVVARHSGVSPDFHATPASTAFSQFFCFAVPTFLALSFYLQIEKQWSGWSWLAQRLRRLLVPFYVWTAIYLLARAAKHVAGGEPARASELLADPVGILFLGTAAMQLYFLPVLFLGNLLCAALAKILRTAATLWLVAAGLVAGVAAYVLSAEAFGSHPFALLIAIQPTWQSALPAPWGQVARVLTAWLACAAGCLAFIFGSALLVRCDRLQLFRRPWFQICCSAAFVGLALFPMSFRLHWAFAGLAAVAMAIALSPGLPAPRWLGGLTSLTFGVFLVHHLVIQAISVICGHRWLSAPIPLWEIAVFSVVTFGLSVLAVWLGGQCGAFGRAIFAIHDRPAIPTDRATPPCAAQPDEPYHDTGMSLPATMATARSKVAARV